MGTLKREQTRDMPPFWQLCEQGKLEEVKRALDNGEDVNDSGDVGATALMSAICNDHKSVVKLLLEHPDIEVNEKRDDGRTALHYAVLVDNVEVTRMLLKHQGLDLMNLDVGSLVGGQGCISIVAEAKRKRAQVTRSASSTTVSNLPAEGAKTKTDGKVRKEIVKAIVKKSA